MNCAHVLGLIDAGPFADYPRRHLEAAWQHARGCATCGSALRAATAMTADLASLAQPAPPPDLARSVLARIARIEPAGSRVASATPTASGARTWWPVATTVGGLAAGLSIAVAMPSLAPIGIASPGSGGVTGWSLILAASLGLYVAGLFAPLSGDRSRDDSMSAPP